MNGNIKVPKRSKTSRVERALGKLPKVADGQWHKLMTTGATTAEQVARSYNVEGASWEFGWEPAVEKGDIVAYLYARWVG